MVLSGESRYLMGLHVVVKARLCMHEFMIDDGDMHHHMHSMRSHRCDAMRANGGVRFGRKTR